MKKKAKKMQARRNIDISSSELTWHAARKSVGDISYRAWFVSVA
jgi:hypothetical protein